MKKIDFKLKFEYKITIIYLIIGFLWIIFSDKISEALFLNKDFLVLINIIKGIFYVTITGLLLFLFVKKHMDKLRKAELDLFNSKEEYRISEERFRLTLEATKIGLWDWNVKNDIWYASPVYYTMLGYAPKFENADRKEWLGRVHPDDLKQVNQKIQNVLNNNFISYEYEARLKHANGSYRWQKVMGVGIERDEDGKVSRMTGIRMDINERKNTEEKLYNSEWEKTIMNKIASVFLTVPDEEMYNEVLAIILNLMQCQFGLFGFINEKGNLIIPSLTKDIWSKCNVEGKSVVFPPETWGDSIWGKSIRLKKSMNSKGPFHIPAGHLDISSFLAVPIVYGNRSIGLLSFANKENGFSENDVTILEKIATFISPILNARLERDRLELNRKFTEIELIKAKEKAEESDRLKSAFLNNISHEIRTPMNAIIGFSGFLSDSNLSDDKRKKFTSIIQNSCNQLLSVVTDLITISSLETKQEKINQNIVYLNHLLLELQIIFKQHANKNLQISSRQSLDDETSRILTDKTKITQILSNLISNAIKFTQKGEIEFGYSLKNDELEFYVKDTGMGIKKEFHEKIFERFRQADESINKQYGGTGIGLSISKGFVELLGGKIWVDSEPDKGSIFYFTIPYKPVNNTTYEDTEKTNKNTDKTILVAEDDENNFLFIEEIIAPLGLNIIRAKNGKELIDLFNENPYISLILMDIKMPVLSGFEAAKIIKERKPDMPIIAQSAYALEHEKAKYELTFDEYLTKPLDKVELTRKISKHIHICISPNK